MRQLIVALVLALALLATAQTTEVSARAFVVVEADRVCATDKDCTLVGSGCCFESNCNYSPVNLASYDKYQALLLKFVSVNCTRIFCAGALCMPPPLSCVMSATGTRGFCTIKPPVVEPVPSTVVLPPVNECTPISGPNCELTCSLPQINVANAMACIPDTITACINTCKNTLATCATTSTQLPGGPIEKTCGYVARNQTLFNMCVDKCRVSVPPPPTAECKITTGTRCEQQCTAVGSDIATVDPALCKPGGEVACWNNCQADAVCKSTPLGCKFVPKNVTAYGECTKACVPTAPTCFKTGCSGEICSSVAVASPCVYTCEAGCYRTAVCQSTAGGCAFAATVELQTCLTGCKATQSPPIVPPVDVCKITGCQRDLCVPTSESDKPCPTTTLVEPTCEQRCLQYAQCGPSKATIAGVDPSTSTQLCGWSPDPSNPSLYGECLVKCRKPENPCFVSGCGAVCSSVASLQPCASALIAPDCYTMCKAKYTTCNMTSTGCLFVSVEGLRACYEKCTAASPAVLSPPKPSPCPTGVLQAECLVNPCDVTRCPAFPDAKCTPDYCGGCRAIFTDAKGNRVNCDGGCVGLPCGECQKSSECSYCNVEYSVAADATTSTTSTSASTTKSFGVCVASAGIGAERCLASNGRLLGSDAICPAIGTVEGSTTSSGDVAPVQDAVASDTRPITQKWVIVIGLIVNQSTTDVKGFNLVNIFVDLVGPGSPNDDEKSEVCEVLKAALKKVDSRIAQAAAADLQCSLSVKTSLKRDVSYVAALTYPNSETDGVATLVLSVSALVAAVFASLF